jgi:hypothetical protein
MPDNFKTDAKNQLSWYHCGRCGSLFQSFAKLIKGRKCNKCGFSPFPTATNKITQDTNTANTDNSFNDEKAYANKRLNKIHKIKHTISSPVRLALMWTLLTSVIIFVAKYKWHSEPVQKIASEVNTADLIIEKENHLLLNKSIEQCRRRLNDYLLAGPPEKRSQYVIQPITAVKRMFRHHIIENLNDVTPPTLESTKWSVVNIGEEKAIETIWVNADGRRYDAIFRKESDEWLIDWENFARYSDMPFSAFLSGDGDAEAEFRLLARERLSEDRKNMPTMSIMFYAPVFGRPAETEISSSEFLIERNSTEGVLLEAAFSALKNKKRPFNAKLANYDPDGMVRVRVKIRRSGEMDTRAFKIVELKACHWYSSDLSGFDVGKEGGVKNQD